LKIFTAHDPYMAGDTLKNDHGEQDGRIYYSGGHGRQHEKGRIGIRRTPVGREVGLAGGAVLGSVGGVVDLGGGAEGGEIARRVQSGQRDAAIYGKGRRVDELLVRLQRTHMAHASVTKLLQICPLHPLSATLMPIADPAVAYRLSSSVEAELLVKEDVVFLVGRAL
jgi:hypothetical protein